MLGGFCFGTILDWKKDIPGGIDNLDGTSLHPKYQLAIFGFGFLIVLIVIYFFPQVRGYGFQW